MTRNTCDRQWQAEALEDGRLEPGDRASFERHAATCRACASEIAALGELRRQLAVFPDNLRTELEHRRARAALLGAAERGFRSSSSGRYRTWIYALAVPALACALFALHTLRSRSTAPGFEVADVSHADWSAQRVDDTSLVTLRDGVAAFHVEHVAAAARFLVQLPDGQIEVRGTRFVVDVSAGVTRSVAVSEGVVWLRRGQRLVVLKRGESYRAGQAAALTRPLATAPEAGAVAEPAQTSSVAALKPSAIRMSTGSASSLAPTPAVTRREPDPSSHTGERTPAAGGSAGNGREVVSAVSSAGPGTLTTASPSTQAPARVTTAGERFGEAMSAFASGDYGRADSLFAAFAREFPNDSRLEDAAFLRADARARRGDAAGAAALARDYLRRYPQGLRRPDAERLIGKP